MKRYNFRFSRDRVDRDRINFSDFSSAASSLFSLVKRIKPHASAQVLTCEDEITYLYSKKVFEADEIDLGKRGRKVYELSDLNNMIWDRSMSLEVHFVDDTDSQPFLIKITCDTHSEPESMKFYGQSVEFDLHADILFAFDVPNLLYSIGDGLRKHERPAATKQRELAYA
ncbi:MAG TPA: hypothetical protein VD928_03825 [Candidatus Paceibacterota bacterium]|nr:hypothetical protein [Candidatus Paceibacterota bacterium]